MDGFCEHDNFEDYYCCECALKLAEEKLMIARNALRIIIALDQAHSTVRIAQEALEDLK